MVCNICKLRMGFWGIQYINLVIVPGNCHTKTKTIAERFLPYSAIKKRTKNKTIAGLIPTPLKPHAFEKLRKATMKSSFSFADFGIFCEFTASATICNEGHGFQPKVSFFDHFPPSASTCCLKVVHLLLLSSFGVTIPHKMSPLFGSFGLVPFFSVPPFGFCCCWPSIARSTKFLQTTQKQFRSAKTNCANRIT